MSTILEFLSLLVGAAPIFVFMLLRARRAKNTANQTVVGLTLIIACFLAAPQTTPLLAQSGSAQVTPVADHHQHLFSSDVKSMLAAQSIEFPVITAQEVATYLDSAGIERALLLSGAYLYGSTDWTVENEYAKVRKENDWTVDQASDYSERLRAFCSFNPLRHYALEELKRCADKFNVPGIKLHFGNSGVDLSDSVHVEQVSRVFRAANEHGLAIVVHLRASVDPPRPYGAEQGRVFLEELLPLVPDVPVQVAHLAGTGPGYDDPPAHAVMDVLVNAIKQDDPRTDRLWFDIAGLATPEISADSEKQIARWIRRVGVGRILFGSDAAVGKGSRPKKRWEAFLQLPLSDHEFSEIADNVAPYLR